MKLPKLYKFQLLGDPFKVRRDIRQIELKMDELSRRRRLLLDHLDRIAAKTFAREAMDKVLMEQVRKRMRLGMTMKQIAESLNLSRSKVSILNAIQKRMKARKISVVTK